MAAKDPCQIWISLKRTGNEHIEAQAKIANKIVSPVSNAAITFKRTFSENLYLASYYGLTLRITNNLAITGQLPIIYENPEDTAEGIAYVRGLDFDETDNRVALVSQARHLVRIYDFTIGGAPLAQIGNYNTAGNVADGNLSDPRDCLYLSNGNLLIASTGGFGLNGDNVGHISEYDPTGAFVASRLENKQGGQSVIGKSIIAQPTKIQFDPQENDYIWISEFRGRLLKVNITTWLVEDMFIPPIDLNLFRLQSFSFIDENTVAIAGLDLGGIAIVNLETKEVLKTLNPINIGGTTDVRDVILLEEGFLGISCWSNRAEDRGAYILPIENAVQVSYESPTIPEDYQIASDRLPDFYDPTTNTIFIPYDCLNLVKDELTLPLRKIC